MAQRKRGIRRLDRHTRRLAMNRPSTYINDMSTITVGTPVWIWCRVSSSVQNAKGNNADQEAELRAAVEARGGTVAGATTYVGVAYGTKYEAKLYKAATCAAHAGAVLLAESTSRFTRHPDYNPKDPKPRMPGEDELRNLRFLGGDVTLVTMHDPNATNEEERGHQSARGQRQKGNKGGRPPKPRPGYKKRRKPMMLSKVFWFTFVAGLSVRETAAKLEVSPNQIQRWRNKLRGR